MSYGREPSGMLEACRMPRTVQRKAPPLKKDKLIEQVEVSPSRWRSSVREDPRVAEMRRALGTAFGSAF